tara:strand:- start:973 stop:1668 length:696 start_codon:yes stop_codon:yes gene_type:complete
MTGNTWLIKDDRVNPYTFFQEVFVFYIFWWTTYNKVTNLLVHNSLLNRIPEEKHVEAKTRIISSIHAIILTVGTTGYLLDYIDSDTWIQFLPLSIAFGIFDMTIITLNYKSFKKSYLSTGIHHSILILAPLTITRESRLTLAQAYICEITVPLIDTSWYLYNAKLTNTLGFKINSAIALVVFFILRVVNSLHIAYELVWRDNIVLTFSSFVLVSLNIYWFKGLIRVYMRTR